MVRLGWKWAAGRDCRWLPVTERREIRSARFPYGLPDRCDDTVWEAHTDAWLLLLWGDDGYEIVGMAPDYDAARVWLDEGSPPAG